MTVIGILFETWMIQSFLRTPDRPVKLLETYIRYLRSVETSIDVRGPDSSAKWEPWRSLSRSRYMIFLMYGRKQIGTTTFGHQVHQQKHPVQTDV